MKHCTSMSLVYLLVLAIFYAKTGASSDAYKAVCNIKANSGIGAVQGSISLVQIGNGSVTLNISLSGFGNRTTMTKHGFHVHQSGDLSGNCSSCLGHFNPYNVTHGSKDTNLNKRHVGDLGNLEVPPNGIINILMTDNLISLHGSNNVVDKGIVVHELEDDLGLGNSSFSSTTGNAGGRLGCCKVDLIESPISRSSSLSALLSVVINGMIIFWMALMLMWRQ